MRQKKRHNSISFLAVKEEKMFFRKFGKFFFLDAVFGYSPSSGLSASALRQQLQFDAAEISALLALGAVDGGLLLTIRSAMIASALLGDVAKVRDFARLGALHSPQVPYGGWPWTCSTWKLIAELPLFFVILAKLTKLIC